MEHQVQGVVARAVGLLHQRLRITQNLGAQLHVARLVHAVHVAEGGGDRKMTERGQRVVGAQHVLGLGVEVRVVGRLVELAADAVFLAAGHAQLDLDGHAHLRHALQQSRGLAQVEIDRVGGKVEHVRAVQRLAVRIEIFLALVQQRLDPGNQRTVGVVGVQYGADAVVLGQQVRVLGGGDATQHLGLEAVFDAGARVKGAGAVGKLDDDVGVRLGGRFHHGVHAVGTDDIDRGQRVTAALGRLDQRLVFFAGDDTGLQGVFGHGWFLIRFSLSG